MNIRTVFGCLLMTPLVLPWHTLADNKTNDVPLVPAIFAAHSFPDSSLSNTEGEWDDDWGAGVDPWGEQLTGWQPLNGFVGLSQGRRLTDDPALQSSSTLQDIRLQLQTRYSLPSSTINVRANAYYDGVKQQWKGQLRELNWQGKVSNHWDLKVGQQVLTWGTGDYLFVNDLFNKDWQSFFSGRDDEYLKAPQLAIKASGYFGETGIDIVVSPTFDADNYINGQVFSYFNPVAGGFNGQQNIAPIDDIAQWYEPSNPEYALRITHTLNQYEYALYAYKGFEKTPQSLYSDYSLPTTLDASALKTLKPHFAPLNVLGASLTAPLSDGLMNIEYAFYDVSASQSQARLVSEDMSKFLIGYEQELVANLTGSLQLQYEYYHEQDAVGLFAKEHRSLLTAQLYYRTWRDTLHLQWFNFYSPSDEDGFAKLKATYQPNDKWQTTIGINKFWGRQSTSFFGQFEHASNVYLSLRRYF